MATNAGFPRKAPTPQDLGAVVATGMASVASSEVGLDAAVATPTYGYTVVPFVAVIARRDGIAVS